LTRTAECGEQLDIVPPAEVAAHLNRLFPFDSATEQLTTMIYGIFNIATEVFQYVSAGHPGPVHLPHGAEPVILESEGYPIGLTDEVYEERSVRLSEGDRLYLYSDGVTEAMDVVGSRFGNDRLLQAIRIGRPRPLQDSVSAIIDDISRWYQGEKSQDDISVLAVELSSALD